MRQTQNVLLLLSLLAPVLSSATTALGEVESETGLRARSLLSEKCLGCHGGDPEKIKSGFDMRTREGLLAGGESGDPAVIPGEPDGSQLLLAVSWEDEFFQMPPKERNRLSSEEVEFIEKWIAEGAEWPDTQRAKAPEIWSEEETVDGKVTLLTSGGQTAEWDNRLYSEQDVWAFRPMRRHSIPWDALGTSTASANPLDAFIQEGLNEKGLLPAGRAEKLTLVRRTTYDLTGLPPTPGEIADFLEDDSPSAYQKLLDRLLESPRYGEQWARHWLDVVRYADTAGFSNDYERPNAWRYRDYVIRSFNRDKPFDRFIVEQIAGDELDPEEPEMRVAIGFLRMGPWEHTGMSVKAVTRQQFLDDVTNSVGITFLGMEMSCFRCHDHKFDPLPIRDYYRFQAAFAPFQLVDCHVPFENWENLSGFEKNRSMVKRLLDDSQSAIAEFRQKSAQAIERFLEERGLQKPEDLPPDERPEKNFFGLTSLERSILKVMQKREAYFERALRRYEPQALSGYSGPSNDYSSTNVLTKVPAIQQRRGAAEDTFILAGGAVEAPGEEVTPGVLSAMSGSNDRIQPSAWNSLPDGVEGRRLALARWIASPANTLTARVLVNRVWQYHFGRGLVATPNTFGKMGDDPSHPKLLDWLAVWFTDHGWSLKRLHRLIMTSEAYQRSSSHPDIENVLEIDPDNDLVAFFSARRLAAEEIRDSMLAVSGELSLETGGPGVYPEINWEVALQPRQIMGSLAPAYVPSSLPEERHRRTIYAFRLRTLPDPMLEVLNRPGPDVSCARRDSTTISPQVLTLFNSQFLHDRALALADRAKRNESDRSGQIRQVYSWLFGRVPSQTELALGLDHLKDMERHHSVQQPLERPLPVKVEREMVEELTGEPFSWEEDLTEMKDFQRDLKPWDVGPETRALAELCLVLLNSNEFLYVY